MGLNRKNLRMGYVKVLKDKSYFKRFQVKFRRRREGKTDYRARTRLVLQDKNKYNSAKYRFCVRFSNRNITVQVIYATIAGDITIAAAYSSELPRYGMEAGLTNYAAAYATGLLCARRVLKKFELDGTYEGKTEDIGEDYIVEEEGDARPFKCLLDVGLVKTSTGNRVFGALKGGLDGGLWIPHKDKRFAGYDLNDKSLDADAFEHYLKGGVVADYAEEMREEEPEKFQSHFAKYLAADQDPCDLEERMEEVFEAIREDPDRKEKEDKGVEKKKFHKVKMTYDEKKAALKEKLAALAEADDEEDDDEDEDDE